MKKYKITFSALMLLFTALTYNPQSAQAFVTTDVLEAAGRIAATVGDVLRRGGINLESGENKSTGDRTGEGTKETDAFIKKIKGWATDYAKERSNTGNPEKQRIRNNALRMAEVKAEILELQLKLQLVEAEKALDNAITDELYQKKQELYESNKQKLLAETQKVNLLAAAEEKLGAYKDKLRSEMDVALADELAKINTKIEEAGAAYEKSKQEIEKANDIQQQYYDAQIAAAQVQYAAINNEISALQEEIGKDKGLHLDTTDLEKQLAAKMVSLEAVEKTIKVDIPAQKKQSADTALGDINSALAGFEAQKNNFMQDYAKFQANLEIQMEEQLKEFVNSILGYEIGSDNGIDVGAILDGSYLQGATADILASMEADVEGALSELMAFKASYEEKREIKIRDINNQIRTLKNLYDQLTDELKQQLAKQAIGAVLGDDVANLLSPANRLEQAQQLNFLDAKKPETAENIDEIRRNRLIERRDAYLSTYADAVILRARVRNDLEIVENFARNTDSMDSMSGVIGADLDLKVKMIEALMQYAEMIVGELRTETATEFAKLTSYKVKNPDKSITNFNLDDYLFKNK